MARGGVTRRSFDDESESEGLGVELEKGHMACELFRMKVRKARWSREGRSTFGWNDLTSNPILQVPPRRVPPKHPTIDSALRRQHLETPCLVNTRPAWYNVAALLFLTDLVLPSPSDEREQILAEELEVGPPPQPAHSKLERSSTEAEISFRLTGSRIHLSG